MGHMSSPAVSINNIRFQRFPSKPVSGLRVVRADELLFAVGPNGAVYTNHRTLSKSYSCAGRWPWSETVLDALDRLGLVTAEDKQKHADWLKAEAARSEAIDALRNAKGAAKDPRSGVTPTHLRAMWDALDWRGQAEAERYGYRPEGVRRKPMPRAA